MRWWEGRGTKRPKSANFIRNERIAVKSNWDKRRVDSTSF